MHDQAMRYLIALLIGCPVLSCGGDQLRTRAAEDLHCDEAQLDIKPLTDQARAVRGCGFQATYVLSCKPCSHDGPANCDCEWAMNTNPAARQ